MKIWLVALCVLVINIPFGFWRENTKKLTFQWFLAIHLPVPFVILLRKIFKISYKFIPIILISDLLGQFIGGKIQKKYSEKYKEHSTSCMFSAMYYALGKK